MLAKSPARAVHGIVSATFSDPTNERLIYLAAFGLVLVGAALLVGTILWWHRGRQEHPALAPLEVMSSHSWEKAPEGERRRLLNSVRMNGELVPDSEVVRPDPVDLEALVRSTPQAFDDLFEPSLGWSAVGSADEAAQVFEVNASGQVELVGASDDAEPAVVDETVAQPAPPNAEEPKAETADEPVAEAVSEPVVEPDAEHVGEAVAEPAVEAESEPAAEEGAEPVAEAEAEPEPEEAAPVEAEAPKPTPKRRKKEPLETVAAAPTEPSR